MFKVNFSKEKSYRGQPQEIGVKVQKFYSRTEDFKHQINLSFNVGYSYFLMTVFFGKNQKHPDFLECQSWEQGRVLKCFDDEETVLLRSNQEYTLREVRWKSQGDGFMYPQVSLMEFKPQFDYPASRFMKQQSEEE